MKKDVFFLLTFLIVSSCNLDNQKVYKINYENNYIKFVDSCKKSENHLIDNFYNYNTLCTISYSNGDSINSSFNISGDFVFENEEVKSNEFNFSYNKTKNCCEIITINNGSLKEKNYFEENSNDGISIFSNVDNAKFNINIDLTCFNYDFLNSCKIGDKVSENKILKKTSFEENRLTIIFDIVGENIEKGCKTCTYFFDSNGNVENASCSYLISFTNLQIETINFCSNLSKIENLDALFFENINNYLNVKTGPNIISINFEEEINKWLY